MIVLKTHKTYMLTIKASQIFVNTFTEENCIPVCTTYLHNLKYMLHLRKHTNKNLNTQSIR